MRNLLEIRGYGPEGAYFEAKSAYEFDRKVEAWAKEYKSNTVPEILTTVIHPLFANQQIDHEYMSEYSSYLTQEERKFLFTCFP